VVVLATRSSAFREISAALGDYAGIVVSVTKGIEYESGLTMSGILVETEEEARPLAIAKALKALVEKEQPQLVILVANKNKFKEWLCNFLPSQLCAFAMKICHESFTTPSTTTPPLLFPLKIPKGC